MEVAMAIPTQQRQQVQYVNETEDERRERLQKEKLKTVVREALEEFMEDYRKKEEKKKSFLDELLS
jgi:hypothetical protein